MIVIGYPGVGKSSFCEHYRPSWNDPVKGYIDLESIWFTKNVFNWAEQYCAVAIGLSRQGFIVCVSAHEAVQKILDACDKNVDKIAAVYPNLDLKDFWIRKLKMRYESDPTGKNELAWLAVNANYERHIRELMKRKFYHCLIMDGENYDICEMILNAWRKIEQR